MASKSACAGKFALQFDPPQSPRSPLTFNRRPAPVLALARLTLAVVTLTAIGQQLLLHVGASYSVLNFFSYFTNLSNLFSALVLLVCAISPSGRSRDIARYLSAVNMTVVGVVFVLLLRKVDLGALLPWVNVVLHYVMPGAIVLDWLVAPPASKLNKRHVRAAFVFPVIYLLYVLARGASTGWYPYPFLDPANVGGYGIVAAYILGIFAVFLLASWLLLAIGNRLVSTRAQAREVTEH